MPIISQSPADDLEERLKTLWAQKQARIVVIDNHCDIKNPTEFFDEHINNEEALSGAASDAGLRPFESYLMSDGGYADLEEALRIASLNDNQWYAHDLTALSSAVRSRKADIVLINAHTDELSNVVANSARAAKTADALKKVFPSADMYCLMPTFPLTPVAAALKQVVSFIQIPVPVIEVDAEEFPTAMHYLNWLLTGFSKRPWGSRRTLSALQHEYKNHAWKDNYLPMIDRSLRNGNTQSDLSYHFLIISDREKVLLGDNEMSTDEKKVIVCSPTEHLGSKHLKDCAAIFIDNSWDEHAHKGALGNGIEALRKLRLQLDALDLNVPILYQSGHPKSVFTAEEIAEVEGLGAVLAAKDVFPKVCQTQDIAEKEIAFSKLAEAIPILAPHVARVMPYGRLGKANLSVVCTRIVEENSVEDIIEQKQMQQCSVQYNVVSHKMYVLALLHESLKGELNNPKLAATSRDFVSFDELQETIIQDSESEVAYTAKPLHNLYTRIVIEHRAIPARVITHNDAKWDNWFQSKVLGDFGSVCPGTEYKDIARALFDQSDGFTLVKDKKRVCAEIANYTALRASIEKNFVPNNDFTVRTQQMIFVEGLRMLSHHAKEEYAPALKKVIEYWANELS